MPLDIVQYLATVCRSIKKQPLLRLIHRNHEKFKFANLYSLDIRHTKYNKYKIISVRYGLHYNKRISRKKEHIQIDENTVFVIFNNIIENFIIKDIPL